MPVFAYKVKNSTGELFTGEAKVDNKEKLLELFIQNGYTAVEVIEKNYLTDISQISIFRKKVKSQDLAQFCRQMAIMMQAGISIAEALDVIGNQFKNTTMKDCLRDVYLAIQKGSSLSHAMADFATIFPNMLISMVEAGEVSGQLEKVFAKMADHFEKDNKQRQKIMGAMTYPIIILVIAIFVVIVMLVSVIPTFGDALAGMDVELPELTKKMLTISDFVVHKWYIIVLLLAGVVVGIKLSSGTSKGKRFLDEIKIKLPIISGITNTLMTARMTSTLAVLLSSGVLIIESLEILQKVLTNSVLAEKVSQVKENIKQGRSLYGSLLEMKYFPSLAMSMVKTGEESGSMEMTLQKAADFYEDQLDLKIQKLTTFIEPAIMVGLGGIVVFIMFSVLYPMVSVYQNMGEM